MKIQEIKIKRINMHVKKKNIEGIEGCEIILD